MQDLVFSHGREKVLALGYDRNLVRKEAASRVCCIVIALGATVLTSFASDSDYRHFLVLG